MDVRLIKAIRDNLAETCMALGMAAPGVIVSRTDERWMCLSTLRHPVSNFAARFNLTDQGLRELCAIGRKSEHFRIYVCDGDQPSTLRDDLLAEGAGVMYTLTTLASDGEGASDDNLLRPVQDSEELVTVCEMIVRTFFRRSEPWLRQHMRHALVSSTLHGHEFWAAWDKRGVAAVMTLVNAGGLVGLYNLCVREDLRYRGMGTRAVKQALAESMRRGKGMTLQCEPELAGWYRRLGFAVVGTTTAFSFNTR